MLDLLKKEANITYTENGAVTNKTSGSDCLNLFGTIGALRHADDKEKINRFLLAFAEDADLAMKILFFARDIRMGIGERHTFKTIMRWLAFNHTNSASKNMQYIAEYGRYDDLLAFIDTPCEAEMMKIIKMQLDTDLRSLDENAQVSLLGKWLPSINASSKNTRYEAKKIAKGLVMTNETYRKTLTKLRGKIGIVENNLREQDFSFNYENLPSKALFKYKNAFAKNDKERYFNFINKSLQGKAKLAADNIMPYELVERYLASQHPVSQEQRKIFDATWRAIPDFCSDENAIAVVDTSGSMFGGSEPTPASVAISLGMYFAERNEGPFKNCFIEFSQRPQLIEIKGRDFVEKLDYVLSFCEIADTNIEAVFDLILNTAVKNKISSDSLPKKIVIISDMEFNYCAQNAEISNFENAKRKFEEQGYQLPQLVFWNVSSRHGQQPVTVNDRGVALVSGASPNIFAMVAGELSPYQCMLDVIESERYAKIAA